MDQILTSIEQLTKALNLLNGEFDPIEIRNLTLCADQKHKAYVEKGLIENNKTITITIDLGMGNAKATAYGCDMSYDYVKINAEYST